mmetsp:Transcript_29966/g.29177  ORF Transcript_29966/g.29177 Transcript_29966/m.29177 type:complete len:103 (+) Transcript_29966:1966-2274(+)
MVQHFSGSEGRIEGINKKILIRGKGTQNQAPTAHLDTHQFFQGQDLGDSFFFAQAFFEYLKYFDQVYEEHSSLIRPLHFYNLQQILRSILNTRRSTTGKEEL